MRLELFRRLILQEMERKLHSGSITNADFSECKDKFTWPYSYHMLRQLQQPPNFPSLRELPKSLHKEWDFAFWSKMPIQNQSGGNGKGKGKAKGKNK